MNTGSGAKKFSQLESRDSYKQFYDEQGFHYGNHHLTADFPRAKYIIDRVISSDVVIEMGCQTGGITRLVAPECKHIIANELSDSYRERAAEVLAGIENVKLIDGFAEDLAKSYECTADVVIAMELLEHVADPSAICEAAKACLVKGGIALFSVPQAFEDPLGEHVREFTIASFTDLLAEYFRTVVIIDAGEWLLAEARK